MSKGSNRRPEDVEEFRRGWEKIFGNKRKGFEDVVLPDGKIGNKALPIEPVPEEKKDSA